jgi:hypothetical protein
VIEIDLGVAARCCWYGVEASGIFLFLDGSGGAVLFFFLWRGRWDFAIVVVIGGGGSGGGGGFALSRGGDVDADGGEEGVGFAF